MSVELRPFERGDEDDLWELKRGFELGIGSGTGGEEKRSAYEAKLTDEYRVRWLSWAKRCAAEQENVVTVADAGDAAGGDSDADGLVGYAFLLPESMAFVWDAAVLNEIFVAPDYRGTGVADDLMDAAVGAARDQRLPLDRMVLDVDRENDRARAFYERHGFDHWGEMVSREL